ncbi:MAG TPA: carboxypeptidase-like regulatory domain-containing protein [Acidobacteriaceae bacterium]|nr:carboxypeptidase-like regulatory domain-containing protein [Acidobacteriaceae bacterium]
MTSCRFLRIALYLLAAGFAAVFVQGRADGQDVSAPIPQAATVIGTVTDINGGVVSGAAITLSRSDSEQALTTTSNESGFFQFANVPPGADWRAIIRMHDFADWTSNPISLRAGQYFLLTGIQLHVAMVEVSVTAVTPEQAATEEVRLEEKQRVLGVIPNFYVVYQHEPAPLTAKLKFHLAFRTLLDPATIGGFVLNATAYQAGRYPDYQEGMAGYGQRLGATFAGGWANVLMGNAILPALLRQDPRYFYKGTGTTRSRFLHALSAPFLTYGDNGRREFNFSGIGGDVASGAVANAYYPSSQRGARLVVKSAAIGAGGRIANGLLQEFVLRRGKFHTGRK